MIILNIGAGLLEVRRRGTTSDLSRIISVFLVANLRARCCRTHVVGRVANVMASKMPPRRP